MKLNKLLWPLLLMTLVATSSSAQHPFTQPINHVGDYYLTGWIHNNYHLVGLESHRADFVGRVDPLTKTTFGTIGVGWRLWKDRYLTIEFGRYNTRSHIDVTYPDQTPFMSGQLTSTAPGIRVGLERPISLFKNAYLTANVGFFSYAVNFNQGFDVWSVPMYGILSGESWLLMGPSLSGSFDYHLVKKFSIFARAQAHYVLNGRYVNRLDYYHYHLEPAEMFSVTTKPFAFQIGVGIKYSLEHKSYFNKEK